MKKYPFKDFAEGKVHIALRNNREAIALMLECEKRGICWSNGANATDWIVHHCVVYTLPICGDSTERRLRSAPSLVFGENVITLDQLQLDDPKPENRYQILIESDGDTTTAKMIVNGKEVKSAQAKRNPDDKPNWKKGAELAFGRLFGSRKDSSRVENVREVFRPAEKGEYVRIIHAWGNCGCYQNGDIIKVYMRKDNGFIAMLYSPELGFAQPKYIASDEYVVLEGYKPKK